MHRGLEVISSRADSLARFIESYSKLARLPQPRFEPLNIGELVQRVATLETRLPVKGLDGPDIVVRADSVQLEQLLINLIRNAVDASLETNGAVEVGWARQNGQAIVCVKDEGLGLANTANLFVPFFSTKTSGSGIGLVLSRQIAEAHGGAKRRLQRTQPFLDREARRAQRGALPGLGLDLLEGQLDLGMHPGADVEQGRCRGVNRLARRGLADLVLVLGQGLDDLVEVGAVDARVPRLLLVAQFACKALDRRNLARNPAARQGIWDFPNS